MINSKGLTTSKLENRDSGCGSFASKIFGFATKNTKAILIGLAVIFIQQPLLFSVNPGSVSSSNDLRAEAYFSPGKGIEQAAADHESQRPSISVAPVNQLSAPLVEAELMAAPVTVSEIDQPTSNASPEILNFDLDKSEASHSKSKTSELDSHQKAPKATLKNLKKAMHGSNDEALSLIWIVILVVLLLWLLGFIAGGFGLGPFIHLLLVIALILLILWLLRVI